MADITLKGAKRLTDFNETLIAQQDDYMLISQDGTLKKIKVKQIKGADNLGTDHIDLVDDSGTEYRVKINDRGEFKAQKLIAYTAEEPDENNPELYDGLIINQIYGGGTSIVDAPVSHSFVELYNMTANEINLKGLYLFYKPKSGSWQSLALEGIVPPYHSFLIRGGEHCSVYKDFVRCKITDYDQQWLVEGRGIKFASTGFSIYLAIGDTLPDINPVRSITDLQGTTTRQPRYIDLLGCGGTAETDTVEAYEKEYNMGMSTDCACRRIDFYNGSSAKDISGYNNGKGNNKLDTEIINYQTCDVIGNGPRSLSSGEWNLYVNKDKINENAPNVINICYGEDGEHSRTFTWQSTVSDEGYLKYKKTTDTKWTTVETSKRIIRQANSDVTIHSIIIHDLIAGTYEYQAGYEGHWSDIETFEVKEYTDDDTIKILWHTDQQGWTKEEYNAWSIAMKNIHNWEQDYDFVINTGDISQNGNRYMEYLWYYKGMDGDNKRLPHMTSCGNNDLTDKKYSDAFANYFTYENAPWQSTYAFDLGFVHFVCIDSNTNYTYVGTKENQYETTDAFLAAEAEWLDQHLTEVKSRETPPKWIIVYSHVSAFTCVRTKRMQRFNSVAVKHKLPLWICGHNHTYTRSKCIVNGNATNYNDYVTKADGSTDLKIVEEAGSKIEDLANGTHYILLNACGYKLTGKEKIITLPDNLRETEHDNGEGHPWWYAKCTNVQNPNYAIITITKDAINIEMNFVQNLISIDENKNTIVIPYGTQTKYTFDTLTINKSDRG